MASEIKVDTIVNAGGDNDSGIDLSTNDKVAIKTANVERMSVASTGATTITTAGNETTLTLKSTDADGSSGPLLDLTRDSASPADGDVTGIIRFRADNDAGEVTTLAQIVSLLNDASNGTEDSELKFETMFNGSIQERLAILRAETVFNDSGSGSFDFRVESNNNINMLHVDAGSDLLTVGGLVGTAGNEDAGYGPLQVGNTAQTDCIIQMLSANNTSCTIHFGDGVSGDARYAGYVQYNHSNNNIALGANGTQVMKIASSGIYGNTTSGGGNVRVQSDGLLQRDTSSQRYKNTINDATHGLTELLNLRSVTFKGNNDGDTIFGGLIAEEVHDAGLTEFVEYDDQNRPDALRYSNMVSLCIKAIQELKTELDNAKARITALESK